MNVRKKIESDIRAKWPNEQTHFTPWLSDNLNHLSSALDYCLDLEAMEKEVGPYRADIVARIAGSDDLVVIENQLTHADPRHLGQLVTYTARLKAKIGVWVTPGYWYTNICAIRSLNRHLPASAGFFAVRLSLSKRQSEKQCPEFHVIEHPKKWQDPVARKFWAFLNDQLPDIPRPSFNPGSNLRRGRFEVEQVGLQIVQHFEADFVRVYITGSGVESNRDLKSRINLHRPALVASLRESDFLIAEDPYCVSRLEVNAHDPDNWMEIVEWLDSQRRTYEQVLREGAVEKQ
ncbi:MAG: hypothetical protein OXK78_02430 [Caldilineaceae bacterium]|nr:hypothetical protein [Caldilineaceae bacterium]